MDRNFITGLTEAAALERNVVTVHGVRGERRWGHGSGFFWAGSADDPQARNLVVTNHHVIADKTPRADLPEDLRDTNLTYWIEIERNQRVPARLLISDRLLDLAILEVNGDDFKGDLPELPNGLTTRSSSREARSSRVLDYTTLGEPVIRIGSPGVAGTADPEGLIDGQQASNDRIRKLLTFGVCGGRDFPGKDHWHGTELLITDAWCSQGNSGGPVIAIRDQAVIGITVGLKKLHGENLLGDVLDSLLGMIGLSAEDRSRFLSDPGIDYQLNLLAPRAEGFRLEIPAYWIEHLWSQYDPTGEDGQYLKRGSLGFESEMESFVRVQLPATISSAHGGQETGIRLDEFPGPKTPASSAGLEHGDAVIAFDGIPTEDAACLTGALTPDTIGRECKMEVLRAGEQLALTVTPDEYIPKRFTRKSS